MQNIPIQLLQALVVFADSENMSEAARQLGITQPALSKRLKALESSLPLRPFAPSGKKKNLTPFGRDLYARLKNRLGHVQEIIDQTCAVHADPRLARVTIAARREILDRIDIWVKFPGTLIFREAGHDEIISLLRAGTVDLGITHAAPALYELAAKPLLKENFQIVVPKSLLAKSSRDWRAQLPQLPCLAYKENDEVLDRACNELKIDSTSLRPVRVTSNYASLARMTEAQIGWCVLPSHFTFSAKTHLCDPLPVSFSPREFKVLFKPELAKAPWFKDLLRELTKGESPG